MDDFVLDFSKNLERIFKEDLVCILLVGSVIKNDTTPFSDIDLVLILKKLDINKIKGIRSLLKNVDRLIDLSFLCHDEISDNPNMFNLGTHGSYQLGLILNNAKCLYGRNVLLDIGLPTDESIRRSLIEKIIQYTWWIRRMFVESNRERSLSQNYQINSRLIKIIKSILYLAYNENIHIDAETAIDMYVDRYEDILNSFEVSVLMGLADKNMISSNSANMSEEYFETRFSIINKIHKEALKLYY